MIEEKEIHLRDYLRVIQKRKHIVATFFIITFITVLILTLTDSKAPEYIATTKVLIEKNEPSGLLNDARYYRAWDPNFLETQIKIMKSPAVGLKIVKTLSLDSKYESFFFDSEEKQSSSLLKDFRAWLSSFKGRLSDPATESSLLNNSDLKATELSRPEIIAQIICSQITVEPVRDSKIVNINFRFKNPVLAERIANTIIKSYIEELFEMKMQASEYAVGWMTKKADEERNKLQLAERALHGYLKRNDIFTIEDRISIIPEKVTELSSKLTKTETRQNELKAISEQLNSLSGEEAGSILDISNKKTIQTIRSQIIKAEQDVEEKSKKYGRRHPLMIRAQDALTVIKEKHTEEINRLIREINNEYQLSKSIVTNLRKELSSAKNKAVNLNEKYIQYKILKRDVETNRHLYNALITKIKEQTVTKKVQRINAWTIENAKTPFAPIGNNAKRNILLGLILGLFGGIGLAFFIEYLDNTVKNPEEAEERLGIPVLGVISILKEKNTIIEGIVNKEPMAAVSENYKAARTALMLSSAVKPPSLVLVSSMTPKEGKTTTVVNFACAVAQTGKRVLIIDADLRRPRIHKIFKLSNNDGLSTYLAGVAKEPAIQSLPDAEGVFVLPSGPIPPDPSELLGSTNMEKLLNKCTENFDFIIIDSPPLLSVSDSLILSRIVEETMVIIKSGKTTYELAASGIKSLKDVNASIAGMIINYADFKRDGYHYYGYGYYSYGQIE